MPDTEALSAAIFEAVQKYLARELDGITRQMAGLSKRLDTLDERFVAVRQAKDGKDADPAELKRLGDAIEETAAKVRLVDQEIAAMGATIAEVGGESVSAEYVDTMIKSAIAALPTPKEGADPAELERISGSVEALAKTVGEVKAESAAGIAKVAEDLAKSHGAAMDEISTTDASVAQLREWCTELKALPLPPSSQFIDESGELVAVYPDGATKVIGLVRGKDGGRGASVMDGQIDAEGQLTFRMSDGRLINVGVVRGAPGKPGEPGKPGTPGRDAIEVRILPAIDESKSYPEGTCAAYRGGTIMAERTTQPILDGDIVKAGWRVILDGIAEESEEYVDGGRYAVRTTTYTSGQKFTRKHLSATMIYRDIWTERDYDRGDTVTWDGSTWHCQRHTRTEPGQSEDWQLIVKRGRNGRDSRPIKGEPGPPGRAGRDLTQLSPDGRKF